MAKLSSADLMDAFKEMTLLELSEFVKDFEDTFGVSAAVSLNGQPPVNPLHDTEPEEDEQTEFDVVLEATGNKKIQVIKEVRVFTRLGLKEAKDLVERAPVTVLERVDRETAQRALETIEGAGGTVTVR
jgi:large subunit ribosomal protein L7/L12